MAVTRLIALALSVWLSLVLFSPAAADISPTEIDSRRITAVAAAMAGDVRGAVEQLSKLITEINPSEQKVEYWRVGATLVEILQQAEDYNSAQQVLNLMLQNKVYDADQSTYQWTQYYTGKNLVWLGEIDEGINLLKTIISGDARLTLTPVQRSAATLLSEYEIARGTYSQSGLLMRRVVVGLLIGGNPNRLETIQVLTDLVRHLQLGRQLPEALYLCSRLEPLYARYIPPNSLTYLNYLKECMSAWAGVGRFDVADRILDVLKQNVSKLTYVPQQLQRVLFLNETYKRVRNSGALNDQSIKDYLKKLIADRPDILKDARWRIIFSYFAALSGDAEGARRNLGDTADFQSDKQLSAYHVLLRSLISRMTGDSDKSMELLKEGMEQLEGYLGEFEAVYSSHMATLTIEERTVLGAVLASNAERAGTAEQKNLLFRVAQILNRDKGKLGLSARTAREYVDFDLAKEDLRTRERLREVRDRLLNEAVAALFADASSDQPPKEPAVPNAAPLVRLGQLEDAIANAETGLISNWPTYRKESLDPPVDLTSIRQTIHRNEAVVVLNVIGGLGVTAICVTDDAEQLHFERLDASIGIAEKLLLAAVHGTHAPSPELDAQFPLDSAFRIYSALFGGVSDCIRGKQHLIIAADPDLFYLPFNALVTALPANTSNPGLKRVAWLPKTYAISVVPSVQTFFRLRTRLSSSRAKQLFLGVGDPDLAGASKPDVAIAMNALYSSRGAVNTNAIRDLPRLPQSAEELRAVANALGASKPQILLGRLATKRQLRMEPLDEFRVISFATHAVVAGEIDGVSQPALVLTPAQDNDPTNDGLLKAADIANLNLDANLVILSACNTAAPDGSASGRGLSGLADAFFFAGARAVAVTQWAVFSESAKRLGSGMIAKSLYGTEVGIAEGLRRTMLDYIDNAQSDYLAHPRFWAPFIIAGDGAIKPLEIAKEETSASARRLSVIWESVVPDPIHSELVSLTGSPTVGVYYAAGIQRPTDLEKGRAGSYLIRIGERGEIAIVSDSREIATSPTSFMSDREGLLLLGTSYSREMRSAAVMRLVDNDFKGVWRFVQDTPVEDMPVAAISASGGYIFVNSEEDFTVSDHKQPFGLMLSYVSKTGKLVMQKHHVVSGAPTLLSYQGATIDGRGRIVVALGGSRVLSGTEGKTYTSPLTGNLRFCSLRMMSQFIVIDRENLEVLSSKGIDGIAVKMVRFANGELQFVGNFSDDCQTQRGIGLYRFSDDRGLTTISNVAAVNELDVWDFYPLVDGTVLVGSIHSFLPVETEQKKVSLEEIIKQNPWSERFWERNEIRNNAFALILDRDGHVVTDRVFHDELGRTLTRVTVTHSGTILGVGSAFGDRGWIALLQMASHGPDEVAPRSRGTGR